MKELPKVYASPMEKNVQNNKDFYYSKFMANQNSKNILREIDNIFHDRSFVYKSEVEITTKDGTILTTLVGKNGNSLLTMDGKTFKITDIMDIKKR